MNINSLEYWVWRVSPAGWERRELLILSARWLIYDEPSVCGGGAPPSSTWHPMWVRKCVVDGELGSSGYNKQSPILRTHPPWLTRPGSGSDVCDDGAGITRDNYSELRQQSTQHNPRKTRDSHALSVYPCIRVTISLTHRNVPFLVNVSHQNTLYRFNQTLLCLDLQS